MSPLAALGLGLPDFYLLLPIATILAGLLSVALGFFTTTYAKTAAGALVVALLWLIVAVIYGAALNTALGLGAAFVAIALAAHVLRSRKRV
jgi:hypothetical protein